MSKRKIPKVLQIAVWTMLFIVPLSYLHQSRQMTLPVYLMLCMGPLMLMTIYYTNFLWLTPNYYMTGRKKEFFIINICLILVISIGMRYWMSIARSMAEPDYLFDSIKEQLLYLFRDIFNLSLSATVATTIKLSTHWQFAEEARLKAEAAHAEAELKSLRSQINPHFLLNTLNNIYALTAIDTERAQEAIQQLSKMLRYLLYDTQQLSVNIKDEIQFLENYVNLMKIRLPDTVKVSFDVECENDQISVVPLISMSLVENAFKHGVSPTVESFIRVQIISNEHQVVCNIENSNHPKSSKDRSGHGIGLQQVQRLLDLAYPDSYTWQRGLSPDGTTYFSRICIQLNS